MKDKTVARQKCFIFFSLSMPISGVGHQRQRSRPPAHPGFHPGISQGQPGGQPQDAACGFAVVVMIGVFVGRVHDLDRVGGVNTS